MMSGLLGILYSFLQLSITEAHLEVNFCSKLLDKHDFLSQSSLSVPFYPGGSGCKLETPSHSILIHMVFALHATASHSIVKCYYDLSKRLGVALRHEEKRCAYVTQETKIMVTAHDEFSAR